MDYTKQIIKKINKKFGKLKKLKRDFGVDFKLMGNNNHMYLQSKVQGSLIQLNIPKVDLSGKNTFGGLIRKEVISQWGSYFDPGVRRKFDGSDVYYSDSSYRVLFPQSARDLVKAIYHLLREGFGLKWTKQVFDCDDFADLADALAAVIALYNGLTGVGIGIGTLKFGFRDKNNKRAGHALCFLPTYEDGIILNFYEPQNLDIYEIEEYISETQISELTIRQFDM